MLQCASVYMYICVCVYLGMFVCVYECMDVYVCTCLFAMRASAYVSTCGRMYAYCVYKHFIKYNTLLSISKMYNSQELSSVLCKTNPSQNQQSRII